ncbi:hypothetical protein BW737_007240 [Actinomyces ruminis]|uniref:Resolvase/invertase-type recombinase catalytic domain-containing protein n=1 Tax=Actinomyces ruminis TaxID=1937003 RepID=A0ABX4MBG7_9ACTO|nr:hypothetical protein BW737_007240 [Actinomyces ruminis]
MNVVGYARVSTADQSPDAQVDALRVAASFAEFERDLVRERTREGLAAVRARRRVGGRPTMMTPQVREARRMRDPERYLGLSYS